MSDPQPSAAADRRHDGPRLATFVVALVGAVAAGGCTTQRGDPIDESRTAPKIATVTTTPVPPASLVDVGGFRMRIRCLGSGTPTILTEAGYQSSGVETFRALMRPLSNIPRVCSRRDTPRTPAGVILLESSHEDEIAPYRRYYGDSASGDWIDGGDLIDIDATARALRTSARDYGAMPLITIRAETYQDVLSVALWRRTQSDLGALSADAVAAVAVGSGHLIPDDDPRVIVEAAAAMVTAIRHGRALPSCDEIFDPMYGRCVMEHR